MNNDKYIDPIGNLELKDLEATVKPTLEDRPAIVEKLPSSTFTRRTHEESKKKRKMAARSRRINQRRSK